MITYHIQRELHVTLSGTDPDISKQDAGQADRVLSISGLNSHGPRAPGRPQGTKTRTTHLLVHPDSPQRTPPRAFSRKRSPWCSDLVSCSTPKQWPTGGSAVAPCHCWSRKRKKVFRELQEKTLSLNVQIPDVPKNIHRLTQTPYRSLLVKTVYTITYTISCKFELSTR